MKTILINGQRLTLAEAEAFLRRFKAEYEKQKQTIAYVFDEQVVITGYAKYLIEYIESKLHPTGERTVFEMQQILNELGASHMTVIDEDHIMVRVDDEDVTFSRSDYYCGHPLSGYATYGSVGGDWRMIEQIATDLTTAFALIKFKPL